MTKFICPSWAGPGRFLGMTYDNGQKRKPIWMTNKALRSVDRKSKVYKKCKDKDHPAVQRANRTAAKEIKKAKRNFEKKLAQNNKHYSKSFFAYVRSKTKSKIQAGAILSDGTLLDSDIKTAQRFNEYFSSVFTAENTSTLPIPAKKLLPVRTGLVTKSITSPEMFRYSMT